MWICEKIKVNAKLEYFKSVVIEKLSSWESIPQSIGSWGETARVKIMSSVKYDADKCGSLQCA